MHIIQIADFLSLKVTEKYTDNSLFIGSLNISVKISDFWSFFFTLSQPYKVHMIQTFTLMENKQIKINSISNKCTKH